MYPLPCAGLVRVTAWPRRSRTGTGRTGAGPHRFGPDPVAAGPNRLRGPGASRAGPHAPTGRAEKAHYD